MDAIYFVYDRKVKLLRQINNNNIMITKFVLTLLNLPL